MLSLNIGKYLSLEEFCTCTQTYKKYANFINPYPENIAETIPALKNLNEIIIDPIIDNFGWDNFKLTYGFCSPSLKRYLDKKDPETGQKNGRIDPSRDQHIAHEINKKGQYYCSRLGAACDFLILNKSSQEVVDWILNKQLPFDSIYYYGKTRPIHISYGPQHKRDIWTFNDSQMPTKKGMESWTNLAKQIPK
jgi:hypothetical protein